MTIGSFVIRGWVGVTVMIGGVIMRGSGGADVTIPSARDTLAGCRVVEGLRSCYGLTNYCWALSAGCISLTASDSAVSNILCLTNRGCLPRT